jgi:hypothetical protein
MLVILVGRQVMLAKVMPKNIMDIYKEQKRCVMPLKTNLQIKELVV